MMDTAEKEIVRTRLRLLDLVKSFYLEEPDSEKMSRWRGTFSALTKESVNGDFDRGAREVLACLQGRSLEELQEEYYKLFTDPFTDKGLCVEASFYLDGRSHDKTLVELRTLLAQAGIEKSEGVHATEDSLGVMLDLLARLIEEDARSVEKSFAKYQEELLNGYLIPFSQKLADAAKENEFAFFYEACSRFFCGYLELEKGLTGTVAYS